MSQIAFDIDTMLHELEVAALPAWDGMPQNTFTTRYYSPAEHEAMFQRRRIEKAHWSAACHAWRQSICLDLPGITDDGHGFIAYTADTRCNCKFGYGTVTEFADAGGCQCVGGLLTKVICEGCNWHHIGTESGAVEAWMDHSFVDWLSLPIFPAKLRGQMGSHQMTEKRQDWLEANYPARFRSPLAPILTTRGRMGGRHVPGYSPYGGFDMGIITDTEDA
ncbi:MAG: hypothetical protein LH616_08185 [Ilumatobacteraceae bacterium]|nr:hypothetical protein [Ilumatobacteraceae bacterium]